ncbi:MAG: hypothetical protein QOH79_1015 [Acidimicrobiaceae bacterium]|jgi:copper(I)-binding protein
MSFRSYARGTRAALAAPGLVALFVIGGCGSSGSKTSATSQASTTSSSSTSSSTASTATSPAATLIEITVVGGQVAGGVKHVQVDVGRSVTIRITSDVAEELHVHGYDLKRDLTAGTAVELTFTADIPGVFEAELEHSGLQVAELQVG